MRRRALRAKFGFKTDTPLAKLLKLPVEQVEAWPEEQGVPALPEVQRLLGVQEAKPPARTPPTTRTLTYSSTWRLPDMRALADKWNARLWLRDWLNKPSQEEQKARAAAEAAARRFLRDMASQHAMEKRLPALDVVTEAADRAITDR